MKFLFLKDPKFYTPLALNCQKGQHLPELEVYKNQSPSGVLQNLKEINSEIIIACI